jgi:peptide/nickel transport system permease protein
MPSSTQESELKSDAGRGHSYGELVWRQFRRERLAVIGLALIVLLFILATAAPLLAAGKPLLMCVDGRWQAPLLRELFSPSRETPEWFLECLFNYLLVVTVASLVLVLPVWLVTRRRGTAPAWAALGIVAVACMVPFFFVQRRLDSADYRAKMAEAVQRPGNWAVWPLVRYGPFEATGVKHAPPNSDHWLGTDSTQRDVTARLIHGARVSLSVGFLAELVAVLIGVFVGAVSAYHGGKTDLVLQRVVEVVICFPTFLLILTIMAFMEKRSIFNVMLVIGLTGWTGVSRLVRGQMLGEKAKDYVTAARALGLSSWRIIFRHLLPNSIAPVLVSATFGVAGAILTESGLSFLGLGVRPPTASWGELLNQAQSNPTGNWWLTVFPGVMIFLTVTVYNLVGEGMRDALDPRMKI